MIPFLLIGGFWAEGKWIRPMVSVMTGDGLSGNSLVPVNSVKSVYVMMYTSNTHCLGRLMQLFSRGVQME